MFPTTRPLKPFCIAVGLLVGGLSAPAHGGDFLFQWDNDKIADTDRHYTNGMRIGYAPDRPAKILQTAASTAAEITWFASRGTPRSGWLFGQDMFTPEDVDARIPDPLDRPYAGWTYGGIFAQAEAPQGPFGWTQQDTVEIDIGIVGPEARAGETQNWFHRLINVSESQGWDSQIGTEPGLLASRTVKLRPQAWAPFGGGWPEFDAIPHATAQAGNIKVGLSGGATVRVGQNLDQDFGPVYGTFAVPRGAPDRLTWSFFIGAEVRAVAWDIFLDGNTFKDSPGVKRNPLVLESRGGISAHLPTPEGWGVKAVRLDISHVHRTREFSTQDKSDRYGSLKLTVNF